MNKLISLGRVSCETKGVRPGVDPDGAQQPIGVVVDSSDPSKIGKPGYQFAFESASDTVVIE